jgi:hypothetical protein
VCYILALRCKNTRTLSFRVHYNYLLTLCHFQLPILRTHTHTHTQTRIDWKCNQTLIFISVSDYFFLFLFFLNFINRCYIFEYEGYPIKSWGFNKEIPIGGLLRLLPTPPLHPPHSYCDFFVCSLQESILDAWYIYLTNQIDVFIINGLFLFCAYFQCIPLLKFELGPPLLKKKQFVLLYLGCKL